MILVFNILPSKNIYEHGFTSIQPGSRRMHHYLLGPSVIHDTISGFLTWRKSGKIRDELVCSSQNFIDLRSELLFSRPRVGKQAVFHSQSWKTACFPALGQENRFSDLQTMNFFFSAWNENSTIIKEIVFLKNANPSVRKFLSNEC